MIAGHSVQGYLISIPALDRPCNERRATGSTLRAESGQRPRAGLADSGSARGRQRGTTLGLRRSERFGLKPSGSALTLANCSLRFGVGDGVHWRCWGERVGNTIYRPGSAF
jgi:hypothetical protein